MQEKLFKDQLKNYWRNIDKNILFSFVILFFLGLFFSFSSTSSLAGERLNKDYYFFFSKHLIFVFTSLVLTFAISFLKLEFLNKLIIPIFIILLLLLILVPLIGVEVKGSKRWLDLYFFRLQPIEILKPFFILITAKILSSDENKTFMKQYLLSFIVLFLIIFLLINQPDIGQSILLIGTWISIVFISGVNLFYIFSFFSFSVLSFATLLFMFPQKFGYIIYRLNSFLDPAIGNNSQSQKALDAIKQGGLMGQGMGEGILKDSVPEAHTDYIIAVIAEEYGSIASIFLIIIFLYVVFRIIKTTLKENNKILKISLCGLSAILIFQTFIHVGVNTSLLPTTGMTLPFLSYGGSSLFGSSILAGVILNYTKKRFTNE
jgi:cell division protein FtsW